MARVAVLDLHVERGYFLHELSARPALATLAASGHDVRWVRDEPGGPWAAALAALFAPEAPDVVVLLRAPSTAAVDAVRAAAPLARVVRVEHGAPSAVDGALDAVVRGGALADLVEGRSVEAARRPTKADLRAAPPPPLEPLFDQDGRAILRGTSQGCPYLADARRSPAFAGVELDPTQVRTAGCTFCLDNLGTFAHQPTDEVVASWVAQLRAARAQRPDLREVILGDERPLDALPGLFEAVAASAGGAHAGDPAPLGPAPLGPIEALVRTRVDWLLAAHEDGTLGRAIAAAAASGSVLHVYLIGFESFVQAELDLYNKGVTVEDNLRAIALLRELRERHGGTFEFARLRAHGVILFSPWTTPEALLENARVMRQVRFEELRADPLPTRLRLYPGVVLHELARRQALLVDAFTGARGDRAAEQGYDASVPWRFADPRVEAIFVAATTLARRWRGVGAADVLEVATRVVLARPELTPDRAAGEVAAVVDGWGDAGVAFDLLGASGVASAASTPADIPPCCADAGGGDAISRVLDHPELEISPLLNTLGRLRAVRHVPCSPVCGPSRTLARARVAALEAATPGASARLVLELQRPVLALDDRSRVALDGAWCGDTFACLGGDPIGSGAPFDPTGIMALTVAPGLVRLHGRTGTEDLRAPLPLLVVPSEPLHATVRAALALDLEPEDLAARAPRGLVAGACRVRAAVTRGGSVHVLLAGEGGRFPVELTRGRSTPATVARAGAWRLDVPGGPPPPWAREAAMALGRLVGPPVTPVDLGTGDG